VRTLDHLSIITARQVSSSRHLFVQAAYPDAVAPAAEAALIVPSAAPEAAVGSLAVLMAAQARASAEPRVARLVAGTAVQSRAVELAPSGAERAAAVAGPEATGEPVPVWSFFLFAAAAARSRVAAPKAHFELRAASVAAAFVFVPASHDAAAVM